MYKKKIIPEHYVYYKVCDECGEKINDYSSTSVGDMHFHSMHSAGEKGDVKKTCYEIYQEKLVESKLGVK